MSHPHGWRAPMDRQYGAVTEDDSSPADASPWEPEAAPMARASARAARIVLIVAFLIMIAVVIAAAL